MLMHSQSLHEPFLARSEVFPQRSLEMYLQTLCLTWFSSWQKRVKRRYRYPVMIKHQHGRSESPDNKRNGGYKSNVKDVYKYHQVGHFVRHMILRSWCFRTQTRYCIIDIISHPLIETAHLVEIWLRQNTSTKASRTH